MYSNGLWRTNVGGVSDEAMDPNRQGWVILINSSALVGGSGRAWVLLQRRNMISTKVWGGSGGSMSCKLK